MSIRKTELKAIAGVELVLVEALGPTGKVTATHYRLSTLRQDQPRVIADHREAEDAFDIEVMASLADPTVQTLIQRGAH